VVKKRKRQKIYERKEERECVRKNKSEEKRDGKG
jgi:hypothetical protein